MTPADLQIPERGSAPVEDPAIAAAKKAEAAKAAWFAIPVSTVADEKTPKYKAAEKRSKEADDAFADAPVASMAGVLTKMRALEKDLIEDQGKSWAVQHVKTVAAFMEGFAGEAQTEPLIALWAEQNRLVAECRATDTDLEIDARGDKLSAIEEQIANTEAKTLAGVVVQIKLRESVLGHGHWVFSADLTRNVVTALERLAGASVTELTKPDPVVALFAEWGAINEEVMVLSAAIPEGAGENMKKTPAVPGKPWVAEEEKEWDAALDRRETVEQKILKTPATSMRGVAVKIRLVTHCTDSTDLTRFHATPAREIDYEKECIVLECEVKAAISALIDAERLAGS